MAFPYDPMAGMAPAIPGMGVNLPQGAVNPAVQSPLLNPQDVSALMAARETARVQSAQQAAALYRAAALRQGGSLEDIPIGQGAGGGFLTLGGVVLRAVEAAKRRKEAELAAGKMPVTAAAESKFLTELDKAASKRLKFEMPDYVAQGAQMSSPMGLGSE
jgi:hypothetical protein